MEIISKSNKGFRTRPSFQENSETSLTKKLIT